MLSTFFHSSFSAAEIAADREESIAVCVPTLDEAPTIGSIVATLAGLREQGAIDEVVVIDSGSGDGTPELAERAGATVHGARSLSPELGPFLGKGDALWRALEVVSSDIVCFVDGDTADFDERFATGLVGPLVRSPELQLVKGTFRRPYVASGTELPDEGGRVTELCARPLLTAFYPPLASFGQPLAGEVAVRRALLETIPFATGFGVEIGMLIDVFERVGIEHMAQVDLVQRVNRHQPLLDLGPMAYTVLAVVLRRLRESGRLEDDELLPFHGPGGRFFEVSEVERPPFAARA